MTLTAITNRQSFAALLVAFLCSCGASAPPEQRNAATRESRVKPRPHAPAELARWRMLSYLDENGQVPDNAIIRAKAQMASLATDGIAGGLDSTLWVPELGPGNVGGRIRAIALQPTIPGRIWVGSVSGGLWRSDNGGTTWNPVDDLMTNLAITSIVFDPTNEPTMYASTGEGFFLNAAPQTNEGQWARGAGVFTSVDGGVTWAQLAATTTSDFLWVNRLAHSPTTTQVLLAATRTGVFRTTTGGTSWTRVYPTGTAPSTVRAFDVKFHATNGNVAVAYVYDTSGGGQNLALYTTNGGVSWLAAGGIGGTGPQRRIELAFHRGYTGTGNGCVYAMFDFLPPGTANAGELWRSLNGGQSYTRVSPGAYVGHLGTQGWYDNALWVDPSDADANPADDTLVVGGINLWRSTNGGVNFSQISDWSLATATPPSAHADHHVIVEDLGFGVTNQRVFFGNDGGIWKTEDVYNVPVQTSGPAGWQPLTNGMRTIQFYGGSRSAFSPSPGVYNEYLIGGTQDNGNLRRATASGTWATFLSGDGGYCASDPTNPLFHYVEYIQAAVYRSHDGGNTAFPINSGITDQFTANFIAPMVLDPTNNNRLLVGTASLWRTNNAPTGIPTWSRIWPPLPPLPNTPSPAISAIAIAPGNGGNTIWIGYNDGQVWRTGNGTVTFPAWTPIDDNASPNPLPSRMVTRITLDPNNLNRVFVTLGGFSTQNLWQTTNANLTTPTWTSATGLPAVPLRDVEVHPHPSNGTWLYAASETGLLVSQNNGQTWTSTATPSTVAIDELFWSHGYLYLVTHGRGMFRQRPSTYAPPSVTTLGSACGTPATSLGCALPYLGVQTFFTLSGGPANSTGYVFVTRVPATYTQVWPGCLAYIDLNDPGIVTLPFTLDATGQGTLPILLADIPSWAGLTLHAQAALPASGPITQITNGLAITFGY